MLFDPRWDRPTLSRFIEWLRTMPADQKYDWPDSRKCACAQFYGVGWSLANERVYQREKVDLNVLAMRGEWTFGALLDRALAA